MTDNSLLQDFIVETGEHLEDTERNLLRLEQRPEDAEILNEIFRSIHTIKGSSEYLGLERIAELSHKLESVLDQLRRAERKLDPSVEDLLIATHDRIAQLVDDLAKHQEERTAIDDLVRRIDGYLGKAEPVSAAEVLTEPSSQTPNDVIEDEYDQELFGIFIDQLLDGFQALCAETQKLQSGETGDRALAYYEDRLGTLKSAANYMGYEPLKEVYEAWLQAAANARKQMSDGLPLDGAAFARDVTAAHMERIKSFFPKVTALQQLVLHVEASPVIQPPAPEAKAKQELRFDDIGMELESDAPTPGAKEIQPELELFSDGDEAAEASQKADHSLLQDFIAETGEHLEDTERCLLRLEQQPEDPNVLNELFRSVHTIKGSSEYLGLERIAELSHNLESLLDLLRRGERKLDRAVEDLLIATHDRLAQLVDDLAQHQAEQTTIDDLMQRIKDFSEQAAPVASEVMVAAPAPKEEGDAIEAEYDEELFGIFVDQLKDGLQELCAQTLKLVSGQSIQQALSLYEDRLGTLKSSANYMGYDKLKQVYGQWLQAVAQSQQKISDGHAVDWYAFAQEVTAAHLDRIKSFFPRVVAVQQLSLSLVAPQPAVEAISPEPAAQMTAEPMVIEGEAASSQDAVPPEVSPATTEAMAFEPSDQGLLGDFITETSEHLDEVEQNLLRLEQAPDDHSVLNELFRSIHTIKGSSEYLGMERIAELSHQLENLLDLLRHGQYGVDRGIIDLLMAAKDRIAALLEDVTSRRSESAPIDDLLVRIQNYAFVPESAAQPAVAPETMETEPTPVVPRATAAPVAVYEEAYDKELFAIFSQQLETGLKALSSLAERLEAGQEPATVLLACLDQLRRLRSSANYMEYDELKATYDQWLTAVDAVMHQFSNGETVEWRSWGDHVMRPMMERVRDFFAAPALGLTDVVVTVPVEGQGTIPVQIAADSMENAVAEAPETVATLQPDLESAVDWGAEVSETPAFEPGSADEQRLLARLESAFDAKMKGAAGEHGGLSLAHLDVVHELFSDEEGLAAALESISAQPSTPTPPPSSAGDIEAFLFSEGEALKEPRKVLQPKPLAQMMEKRDNEALSPIDEDEGRGRYQLGRRQTDKFRERLQKQSIRVDATKIDALMNQVGELVVTRAGFSQLHEEMRELMLMMKLNQNMETPEMQMVKRLTGRIYDTTMSLGRITSELQDNVMKVRMLPIAQLFSRYPRVVHDLIRNTDKQVELEIHGEETELDRMVIEQISDPLVHIIRNAVDHGIEPAKERVSKGKPENGTLKLEAYPEGNYVVIEVSDDGRGIEPDFIKAKALSKGFIQPEEADRMSEEDLLGLIMRPGFSTADEVTTTSGRGVGMDVVKENIERLNGTIETQSMPGAGTLFRIKIPLTLAIIPALLVHVAGEIFTIPLSAVDETIRIRPHEISTIEDMEVYYLRDSTLPLIRISQVLKMEGAAIDSDEVFVVVVNTGNRQAGLIVDKLRGREEVVIKPLEDYLQEKSGFSGATILGDGAISLILDVSDLVHLAVDQHIRRVRAVNE
jgi:two-component system chemotaxis sensor kinase CheA